MTTSHPHPRRSDCPECRSRNVLVVAMTSSVASLYCLACEHLFAAEVVPGPDGTAQDEPPAEPPRALSMVRFQRAA